MEIMQYEQCESRRSQALNYQPFFGNWARANKNNKKKNFTNKQITLQKQGYSKRDSVCKIWN